MTARMGRLYLRLPEWIALSLYAALLAAAIPRHEPWADEAQAWQLARTLSLPKLFGTYIRYEGSPGLWHLLLWILVRLHAGYTGLHWICGGIAVGSAALLLFASPLPRSLRLTLPFTYFLAFQFAAVARNYVLAPLLFFALAYCWRRNPNVVAVLLGLLANTSLHLAVLSGGLAVVYAIEQLRAGGFGHSARRRTLFFGALIVACLCAFAIWTAWPPRDLPLSRGGASQSIFAQAIASLLWGVYQPWGFSIVFWIAIGTLFAARRKLLYLLPVVLFALFSGATMANWWHVGLVVPALIALLWITWPQAAARNSIAELVARLALLLMIGTHLLWSAYAFLYDRHHAYSPDRETAAYLAPYVRRGERIALTYIDDHQGDHAYDGVGLLPYFDHNIFVNLPNSFWSWSDKDTTEDRFNSMLRGHPGLVVVEVRYKTPPAHIDLEDARYQALEQSGYSLSRVFCGTMPMRLSPGLTMCHVVFEYTGQAAVTADRGSVRFNR